MCIVKIPNVFRKCMPLSGIYCIMNKFIKISKANSFVEHFFHIAKKLNLKTILYYLNCQLVPRFSVNTKLYSWQKNSPCYKDSDNRRLCIIAILPSPFFAAPFCQLLQ